MNQVDEECDGSGVSMSPTTDNLLYVGRRTLINQKGLNAKYLVKGMLENRDCLGFVRTINYVVRLYSF